MCWLVGVFVCVLVFIILFVGFVWVVVLVGFRGFGVCLGLLFRVVVLWLFLCLFWCVLGVLGLGL